MTPFTLLPKRNIATKTSQSQYFLKETTKKKETGGIKKGKYLTPLKKKKRKKENHTR
jgi:Cys-tRNA synthase (O-phospho-L-seryl-tRNA:Cys-tRNA synthase)